MANMQAIPDVLAWPLQEAVAELERANLAFCIREAFLPDQELAGHEPRVARVKVRGEAVELVTVKVPREPAGKVPPV
jgi:hypothetical protein